MEGVDRCTLQRRLIAAHPGRHHLPETVRLDERLAVVAGQHHDLPAPARTHHVAVGHGPARIAVLHRVIGQVHRLRQHDVEHQPGLVQAEVDHGACDVLADRGAGAVATDDEPGLRRLHLAAVHRAKAQRGDIGVLPDIDELMPQLDFDLREARDAVAQHGFQLGLVKVVVVGAPVRAERGRAAADEHRLARAVDEVHALRAGPGDRQHLLAKTSRLKGAQHLAVEVDRTRQRKHAGLFLQHQHRPACGAQQVGQHRAGRPQAHDGHVVDVRALRHSGLPASGARCRPAIARGS
ncbi:hypothetical protein D3C87_1126350 [compost metagenome]